MSLPAAHRAIPSFAVRHGLAAASLRETAEETPVAIVYDGSTHAVLMATPADLEDLAVGFSLTEGVAAARSDIRGVDIVPQADGVELRIWLAPEAGARRRERQRLIVGPTGCGLCGVESLEAASPRLNPLPGGSFWTAEAVMAAVDALEAHQPLGRATRAAHAAGLWLDGGMAVVREDVGRHNALDKLAGAAAGRADVARAIVALTSRVSVEMVQKVARMGVGCIAAVSAPTALAVRTAQAAGIALAAVVRADGFEVFAHGGRIRQFKEGALIGCIQRLP
jgi:FdhD protein